MFLLYLVWCLCVLYKAIWFLCCWKVPSSLLHSLPITVFKLIILSIFLPTDPPSELRLHSSRAQWQHPLRLLLTRGTARHLPGPGHGGHCKGHALELRLHSGLRGQLWRERRRCFHPEVSGGWWVHLASYIISACLAPGVGRYYSQRTFCRGEKSVKLADMKVKIN